MSYKLRSGISLTHTTHESLSAVLERFFLLASQLSELRHAISSSQPHTCTHEAFRYALTDVIKQIEMKINSLSEQISPKRQEKLATLIHLTTSLKDTGQLIQYVYMIYDRGLKNIQANLPAVSLATHLLTQCEHILNDMCIRRLPHEQIAVVHRIYIRILKPYLTLIDNWLSYGTLNDIYEEFLIRRKKEVALDQTFWDRALEYSAVNQTLEVSVQDYVNTPELQPINVNIPTVLQPILTQVATIGKAVEMLIKLNCIRDVVKKQSVSLCDELITQIINTKLKQTTQPDEPSNITADDDVNGTVISRVEDSESMRTDGLLDKYMKHCNMRNNKFEPHHDREINIEELDLAASYTNTSMDIVHKTSNSLNHIITHRYEHVSKSLLETLKTKSHLYEQISIIRKVFFLELGDELCVLLFDKMSHGEDWREQWSLTLTLRYSLESQYPQFASNFSVYLTEAHRYNRLQIHSLEQVHLTYEVDWPVNVVYDQELEDLFNSVHQFLLQIKLSKYLNDRLSFSQIEKRNEVTNTIKNKLYKLRSSLIFVINALHEYVSINVLHTSMINFNKQLDSATNLDKVIYVCRKFSRLIVNRCFLRSEHSVIRDHILMLLNTSVKFYQVWTRSEQPIRINDIERIESDFISSLSLLASFLTSIYKTGSAPYLEYLVNIVETTLKFSRDS